MVSCQKCRQPISPASFANYDPTVDRPPHAPSSALGAVDDSVSSLSPSTYDLLSHSERYPAVPAAVRPYYQAAIASPHRNGPPHSSAHPRSTTVQRLVVPAQPTPRPQHHHLGPAESFVVLTDSVFRPPSAVSAGLPQLPSAASVPTSVAAVPGPTSLNSRLTQLAHLSSLLSSSSAIDHPVCTECADTLVVLMQAELDHAKRERDRLIAFEKDVVKKRHDAHQDGTELTREGLERDIAKLKKAEQAAVVELKSVESTKEGLEAELEALKLEEEQLAKEEAEFWTQHSKYILERDTLKDRQNSLITRVNNSQKELDKLQRTNVYNDTFCIGQESTLGTINSLRLGRLASISPPVEWSEINAALGHTLLLLQTISLKFGMRGFVGWKLVCKGSFSRIVKIEEGANGRGEGESYELYGSSDLSISRVLQNRRFDFAMVAFLDCLRQLIEWVSERDRSVRVPHKIVKDKIGDVSIKFQFGSDETWSRALRHVLLDLKILLGRASI
ncbi:beclin 1 [Sporobolomyces koalae]|uniref:beclin 1 n=1 Tax=Sporobolomyces koalae TaxID=500713 RepID=UPI00317CDB86